MRRWFVPNRGSRAKALLAAKMSSNSLIHIFSPFGDLHPIIKRAGGSSSLLSRVKYLLQLNNLKKSQEISPENWTDSQKIVKNSQLQLTFLTDRAQRVVLPSGPINWFHIFAPHFPQNTKGFMAINIQNDWLKLPNAEHSEIKQLWSLIALVGQSLELRKVLKFSPMANEIADSWTKTRFKPIEENPNPFRG